jgi:hypothetical protein
MDIAKSILVPFGGLPFISFFGLTLVRFAKGADLPRAAVDAFLVLVLLSYLSTEIFGLFHQISFQACLALWAVFDGWVLYQLWEVADRIPRLRPRRDNLAVWIIGASVLITGFIALTTVPNNWDSQTYHLPRIEHWIQNRSLEFYPTSISRQNDYGPLAEILLLQTRVLSGSDFFYPLIQWISMLCGLGIAFRISQQLGGNETQSWMAVVFVATLPIGILESTSTQNDYVVAALLGCFVTLGLEAVSQQRPSLWTVLAAVAAVGLSGITKPTGFLIGSGFALWFALSLSWKTPFSEWLRRAAGGAGVLALIVTPSLVRYVAAHHGVQSELSQHATNGSFGLKQTFDNLIRDGMLNFNTGIPQVDEVTNGAVATMTRRLGLDTYRLDTSEPGQPFSPGPLGVYIFHEDNGPNLVQSILIVAAFVFGLAGWAGRGSFDRFCYWLAWLTGLVVFAAVIRWNLFQVRYHLPAFLLAAPIVACAWPERWSQSRKAVAMLLFLAVSALPVLLLNQARELVPLSRNWLLPLNRDRVSYLVQSRLERLFVNQPALLAPYQNAVEAIVKSDAAQIGLVLGGDSWEYPVWSMLRGRELRHSIRIEHVNVAGQDQWPLGPFMPKILFWNNGIAPAQLSVSGKEFVRLGPPAEIAVFAPP